MTLSQELLTILPERTRLSFGQLLVSRSPAGLFAARHRDDADELEASLEAAESPSDLREIAKYDASGEYRPLRTAPTLRRGWRTSTPSETDFLARLDAIYPGAFATWVAWRRGALDPVPLRVTLERQTGMYRLAGSIDDNDARRIPHELCAPGCLRRVLWPIDASGETPVTVNEVSDSATLPLICCEACTFVVSHARQLAKEARESLRT